MLSALRERLKRYFVTGAKPTQEQFAELIDSVLVREDDGISTQVSQVGKVLTFSLPEDHQANTVFQQSVCIQGDLIVEGQVLGAPSSNTCFPSLNASSSNSTLVSNTALNVVSPSTNGLPIGSILLYCGAKLPDGFLPCDGRAGTPEIPPLVDNPVQPIRYIIKNA